MKKTIFIIAIAVTVLTIDSRAQESIPELRNRLLIGLKVGANYSNVYDAQGENFDANPKLGLATGVFVAIPLGKYLGIQPEILLSQKGFKATGQILGAPYDFRRTTSYVDIPLFFSLKPSESITFLAGPQFSYLLKQKDVFANATTTIQQEQEFENDNIRKNTLCFASGVDINVQHFVLGARVAWDVFNNNGNGTSTTPRYKNVWLQATIGYRFYHTTTVAVDR